MASPISTVNKLLTKAGRTERLVRSRLGYYYMSGKEHHSTVGNLPMIYRMPLSFPIARGLVKRYHVTFWSKK
jgi:hypothetical protein